MEDTKHWLTSKAVWTSILGFLASVLPLVGVHFLKDVDTGMLAEQFASLATAVFFILTAVFRIGATTKLTN